MSNTVLIDFLSAYPVIVLVVVTFSLLLAGIATFVEWCFGRRTK